MIRLLVQITCDLCPKSLMLPAAKVDTAAAVRAYAEDEAARMGWAIIPAKGDQWSPPEERQPRRRWCVECATKQAHKAAERSAAPTHP